MNNDKMRAEFEEWCARIGGNISMKDGYYLSRMVEFAWAAWQASRSALVVELPDWSEYDTPRQAIDACERSLTERGIGVSK